MAALTETMTVCESAMLTASGAEPQTPAQARKSSAWDIEGGWRQRELEEIASLLTMGVIEFVPLDQIPKGTKLVSNKMVYKEKPDMPGVPGRRKYVVSWRAASLRRKMSTAMCGLL